MKYTKTSAGTELNPPPCSAFSPDDMEIAHVNFGAMCGHGALAAALGIKVCYVMQYFDRGGWVSIPVMESAIRQSGHEPGRVAGWYWGKRPSVTLIQFLGPWMDPRVPATARCKYRHWIASTAGMVWDANSCEWQTLKEWERDVIPDLLPKRCTGFGPFRTLIWDRLNAEAARQKL